MGILICEQINNCHYSSVCYSCICLQCTVTVYSNYHIVLLFLSPVFSHYCRNCAEKSLVSLCPSSDYIFNFLPSWLLISWNVCANIEVGSMSALFSERKTQSHRCHATSNIIQYGCQPHQKGSTPIKALATMRTRGGASSSDRAFEKCMPHVARLSLRVICFSENVTASGRR